MTFLWQSVKKVCVPDVTVPDVTKFPLEMTVNMQAVMNDRVFIRVLGHGGGIFGDFRGRKSKIAFLGTLII